MILEGQVWDIHTGYPLAGAQVVCAGPQCLLQGYSDAGGYFKIPIAKSGPWQVSVQKSPYTGESRSCLMAQADVFLNISLAMDGLEDQLVTA